MLSDTVTSFVILCENPSRATEVGDGGQDYGLIFLDLWGLSPLSEPPNDCLPYVNH